VKEYTEGRARTIDASCKIIGTAALVIGGLVGLVNYIITWRQELAVRRAEVSKPVLEERLQICVDLTAAAGQIAAATTADERALGKKQFEEIYWGRFSLVEGGGVELAAANLDRCLQDSTKCDQSLQVLSRQLGRMCRMSLGPNWGFPGLGAPTNLTARTQ
jgi:hypothetical protein